MYSAPAHHCLHFRPMFSSLWEDLDIWGAYGYLWGSWQGSLLVAALGGVVGQSPTIWTEGAILVADMVPNRLPRKMTISTDTGLQAAIMSRVLGTTLTTPRWQSTVVHGCRVIWPFVGVCVRPWVHTMYPMCVDDLRLGLPGGQQPSGLLPGRAGICPGMEPAVYPHSCCSPPGSRV